MSFNQLSGVMKALNRRSEASRSAGGDGFISTYLIKFDAGLSTRAIRRVLDQGVASGVLERQETGPGNGYKYRIL